MGIAPDNAMLLQLCSSCLHELAVLRQEMRDSLNSLKLPSGAADAQQAAASTSRSRGRLERLRDLCAVQDEELSRQLLSSLEDGDLATDLRVLGQGASWRVGEELRAGRARAVVLDVRGVVRWDIDSVMSAVNSASGGVCQTVFVFPLFVQPCWQLVEVLLQACRRERLLPPLDFLLEATGALLMPSAGATPASRAELLAAVSGALVQPEVQAVYATEPGGRIVVNETTSAKLSEKGASTSAPCFPLFSQKAGDATSTGHVFSELNSATQLLASYLQVVQAAARPSVLLGLVGVLSRPGAASALGIPEDLWRSWPAGAILWAYESAKSSKPGAFQGAHNERGAMNMPTAPAARQMTPAPSELTSSATSAAHGAAPGVHSSMEAPTAGAVSSLGASMHQTVASRHPPPTMHAAGVAYPAMASGGMPPVNHQESASNMGANMPGNSAMHGHGDVSAEDGMETHSYSTVADKYSLQAHFVQCFKDDIRQDRPLLMAQVNNLYMMRNGGKSLPYKDIGYDSLHDFLMDMPGLQLLGLRNKMEIRIQDHQRFQDFCDEVIQGQNVPQFNMPLPMPADFLRRVIAVFRHADGQELTAQTFRNTWNLLFPTEKLQCRNLGYRDLKGLLANVSFIDKIGRKNNVRYLLKPDCNLDEMLNAASTGTANNASAPSNDGLRAQQAHDMGRHSLQPPGHWPAVSHAQMMGALPLPGQRLNGAPSTHSSGALSGHSVSGAYSPEWDGDDSRSDILSLGDSSSMGGLASGAQSRTSSVRTERTERGSRVLPAAPDFPSRRPPQPPDSLKAGVMQGESRIEAPQGLPLTSILHREQRFGSMPPMGTFHKQHKTVKFASTGTRPAVPRSCPEADVMDNLAHLDLQPSVISRDPRGRPMSTGMQMDHALAARMIPPGFTGQEPMRVTAGGSSSSQFVPDGVGVGNPGLPPGLSSMPESSETETRSELQENAGEAEEVVLALPRRQRQKQRGTYNFISTPAAMSTSERDASTMQGRFDMGFVHQSKLRTDRPRLIADLSTSRVLFSNEACDALFETVAPLQQRELNDLILEEDRETFSASIMYLTIGSFAAMEPQEFRVLSTSGARRAVITGEKLVDSWWCLDFDMNLDL